MSGRAPSTDDPHALLDRLRELRHDASICTSRDTQRGVWLVVRILWRDGQIWTATILAEGKDETSALRVAVECAEQRARPGRVVPEKDASPRAQPNADWGFVSPISNHTRQRGPI